MGKAKYGSPESGEFTPSQWRKKGYIVKDGAKGKLRHIGGGHVTPFYTEDEVKFVGIEILVREDKDLRNAKARRRRMLDKIARQLFSREPNFCDLNPYYQNIVEEITLLPESERTERIKTLRAENDAEEEYFGNSHTAFQWLHYYGRIPNEDAYWFEGEKGYGQSEDYFHCNIKDTREPSSQEELDEIIHKEDDAYRENGCCYDGRMLTY